MFRDAYRIFPGTSEKENVVVILDKPAKTIYTFTTGTILVFILRGNCKNGFFVLKDFRAAGEIAVPCTCNPLQQG